MGATHDYAYSIILEVKYYIKMELHRSLFAVQEYSARDTYEVYCSVPCFLIVQNKL